MDIDNTVVAITGAGSGIGRALAESFAAAGARLVLGDIDDEGLAATADRLAAEGATVTALHADASSADDIAAMVAEPVDVFVANAGVVGAPGLGGEADWDRILEVNLRAHIRAARLVVPQWQARGRGHFVAVASAAGLLTQIGDAGYAVTKHAAVGFAEWLAVTYGDDGIGVTCVCPMGVDTALLSAIRDSDDPAVQLGANSVVMAGAVLSAREVADQTVAAVRDGRFLVLPHPEVRDMLAGKVADHDRWIAGMQRYQRSLRG
ncbi:SDR family oxidoreductase [Mycolicibacterium litorale]|uniref:Dehydrogenase n=1 Tax=Mycolicibacterium litorale TaxID=758802 RepID=A0AAD1IPM6_9MYCO|nr:SDR family oxidoreductase [Mycolicibacterium litorale]MCV7416106.1 SDR family oxidoreductase [Mycolicibacterium litorale]TDY09357.1 NADP-dependent 3-hydroxy acid dehydrogenase YdfG [Mycolicibacterium litorale]BBY17302.1 dehydrogenase [Mycolicibacterium litorale]